MENIVRSIFTGLYMVRKDRVWRLVFGAAIYNTYGETIALLFALNGKVYECKNSQGWRRIINNAASITKEQFDLYIKYVIDQNYSDVKMASLKQKLEQKYLANNLTNSEVRNLLEYRQVEEIAFDEMITDVSGNNKGLTYFKCLIQ